MPRANFSQDEIEQYYRVRLDSFKLHHSKGLWWRSRCPIHSGENVNSLAVNFEEGNFYCFSCGAKGGSIFSFEQELLRISSGAGQAPGSDHVLDAIHGVIGTPFVQRVYTKPFKENAWAWDRSKAQDYYRYTDELGQEIFTVWRFIDRDGNKITPPDHPCVCSRNPETECEEGCKDGRVWGSKGCRRVLYRLPDIISSALVFVCEGEKDVNNLSRALALFISRQGGAFPLGNLVLDRVAVTTNVGGASGWKAEYGYGEFFKNKVVVKLGDNDASGKIHTQEACEDIAKHALQLYTLDLPVGPGEDISDYLKTHDIRQFVELLAERKSWEVAEQKQTVLPKMVVPRIVLVPPSHLVLGEAGKSGDWLVEDLIERGTRGLVVAAPKCGKSLLFLDMAICLGCQDSFLGAAPYHRPVKVAIISREDGPVLVHRRLTQLAKGRRINQKALDQNILVNTSKQSANFHIDVQKDLDEMAMWLKAGEVEFCVIDVLNRLHLKKENSTDEMGSVMLKFDELSQKSGAQICVIHHTNSQGEARGAGPIESWPDFICKLEQDQTDESVKKLLLKTKSTGAVLPRTIRYWQSEDKTESRIMLVVPKGYIPTTKHEYRAGWVNQDADEDN